MSRAERRRKEKAMANQANAFAIGERLIASEGQPTGNLKRPSPRPRPAATGKRTTSIIMSSPPGVQEKSGVAQHQPSGSQNGRPAKQFDLSTVDEGLLGLALCAKELHQRWDLKAFGNLGDLGTWRPERRDAPLGADPWVIRRWARGGGQGEYRLQPDVVRSFLEAHGLNHERVLVDLQDMGITRCDPGHSTKLVRMDGETSARRMVVLPDRYIRRRSDVKLGSAVARSMARATSGHR